MKNIFYIILALSFLQSNAQSSYTDSLIAYQQHYASKHGVVKEADKSFISFYAVDPAYRIVADFERKENSPWFNMETSGTKRPLYRVYGTLRFHLDGKEVQLNLYQSQSLMETEKYKSHLFLPFTDATSGEGSYEGGRYLDLSFDDIKDGKVIIDFNKAYNPYCAYTTGYNCPIPPKENTLNIKIEAGEKAFGKSH